MRRARAAAGSSTRSAASLRRLGMGNAGLPRASASSTVRRTALPPVGRASRGACRMRMRGPVERVYVPVSDVWRATGMGTAAITRRRPDGRLAYGAFLLKLSEHGISGVFGKPDAAASAKDFLDDLLDMIPPMEEGSLADASVFVYGAMGLAETQNAGFPPDEIGPYLDLLPPPPGGAEQWLEALVGPGGR